MKTRRRCTRGSLILYPGSYTYITMSKLQPLNIARVSPPLRLAIKSARPPSHLMTRWHKLGRPELSPLRLCPGQASSRCDPSTEPLRTAPHSALYFVFHIVHDFCRWPKHSAWCQVQLPLSLPTSRTPLSCHEL
jgi:hypothetical protein